MHDIHPVHYWDHLGVGGGSRNSAPTGNFRASGGSSEPQSIGGTFVHFALSTVRPPAAAIRDLLVLWEFFGWERSLSVGAGGDEVGSKIEKKIAEFNFCCGFKKYVFVENRAVSAYFGSSPDLGDLAVFRLPGPGPGPGWGVKNSLGLPLFLIRVQQGLGEAWGSG